MLRQKFINLALEKSDGALIYYVYFYGQHEVAPSRMLIDVGGRDAGALLLVVPHLLGPVNSYSTTDNAFVQ